MAQWVHYHRLKAIIWPRAAPAVGGAGGIDSPTAPAIGRLEMAGYMIGTTCGLGVFAALRSLIPSETVVPLLAGGGVAELMVLTAWIKEAMTRTAA